jgi:hypothetical protein
MHSRNIASDGHGEDWSRQERTSDQFARLGLGRQINAKAARAALTLIVRLRKFLTKSTRFSALHSIRSRIGPRSTGIVPTLATV